MGDSPIVQVKDDDQEMQKAAEQARLTFKYFWRELSWENRRIVPALDLAAVKAPFSDSPGRPQANAPNVEHMWVSEIEFDGASVSGVLLNAPNGLKSLKEGDQVRFPAKEMTDWMYVMSGDVFGAHTVNLIRSRMSSHDRADHDQAWGLNFGDPKQIRIVPTGKGGASAKDPLSAEHPMSENMTPGLAKQLAADPSLVNHRDEDGWTFLHRESLAGNAGPVKVLLDHGADFTLRTNHGATAMQLAYVLGWEKVAALLMAKGARG